MSPRAGSNKKVVGTARSGILMPSFLAGAAALAYELICHRYLLLVLGGEAYVVAVTVGCYMIGLSAGSILFGALSDKNRRQALCLSVFGFAAFCALSPLIYLFVSRAARFGSIGMRVAACFLIMLPAAICAGGAIPCLIKYIGKKASPASVYAAYTLGSVAGSLACGYLFIRLLGITATALLAAGLALLCGALALFARSRENGKAKHKKTEGKAIIPPNKYSKAIVVIVIAAYCASGFASMIFEVFQTKMLTLFFRDSVYDFAIILTVYLIGLFIGNYFGGRAAAKSENLLYCFSLSQMLAGAAVILGLYIVNIMPAMTYDITSQTTMLERFGGNAFLMSNLIKTGYTALVVLIPAFLWGMGFPLVNKISSAGEGSTGKTAGLTIGINTLFCAGGSLISAFWLVDILGIRGLVLLSGIICVVTGAALAGLGFRKYIKNYPRQPIILSCLIVLSAGLFAFLPEWDKFEMSTSFLKPGQEVEGTYEFLFYKEDAYGITSVVDFFPSNQRFLTTNRRYCQNSSEMLGPEDHRRLGVLPLLIHQNPKDVLMVGLGAGITLGGANEFPDIYIDCVEISGSVVEAAKCFGPENNFALDAKNVNLIVDDGRNYIKNTNKSYDVIIADIFFPMSSGSSSLFSREYYELCKTKLNQNGLMAQWIPVHQFSAGELDITIKTFATVFENCQLWYGMIGTSVPVVGIIGSEEPVVIDGGRLTELYGDKALLEILSQIALDDEYMMLSHFIAHINDTDPRFAYAPVNTDDKPILEYLNPENNSTYFQKAYENIRFVSNLKLDSLQNGYCINVDEDVLDDYNSAILDYIYDVFNPIEE